MPQLSVITTIYNAEPYLEESLSSVFEQTFQDFELILVNDGSTDKSKEIVLKYLRYPNVRLLENKNNEGIPLSRNRALLIAQGEYVAIHDGDDVSLPLRFEREVEFLKSHSDIDFIGSHATKISHTGEEIGTMSYPPVSTQQAFYFILRHKLNPIIDPSCMYRKKVVLDSGGYTMENSLKTALDLHLWCRLLNKGHKLSNIQECLIKYRINPHGMTRLYNEEMKQATNDIVATFRRKNFKEIQLKSSLFEQDSFTEIYNNNMEN